MRKVVLALVAALSALLAVPALAADATFSSASRSHAWEGGPMNGVGRNEVPAQYVVVRCSAVYQCDNEHIELKEPGSLTVDIKAGSGSEDLDVRLFASDEAGTAPGTPPPGEDPPQPIAEDARTEKDAKLSVKNLKAGFYVIQVAAFSAANGTYAGTASFTPAAPAVAPPAPGTTAPGTPPSTAPTPQQTSPTPAQNKASETKRKKKFAACKKKAKKIKNKKKRAKALKTCKRKHGKKKA